MGTGPQASSRQAMQSHRGLPLGSLRLDEILTECNLYFIASLHPTNTIKLPGPGPGPDLIAGLQLHPDLIAGLHLPNRIPKSVLHLYPAMHRSGHADRILYRASIRSTATCDALSGGDRPSLVHAQHTNHHHMHMRSARSMLS